MTPSPDTTEQTEPTAATAYDEVSAMPPAVLRPHPANPRTSLGDLADLVASLTASGVLEPIVAVPAELVEQAWPEHTDAVAGATYVTLLGHRRTAAAELAGLATVPVVVRTDLAGREAQLRAMATENIQRESLSPLDEANAFAALKTAGWAQRRIANELGCAQSHVSKRLKLLAVPDGVAAAVDSGSLEIGDALLVAKLGDSALMEQAWEQIEPQIHAAWFGSRDVEDIVEQVRREAEAEAALQVARERAEREGVRLLSNPYTELDSPWEQVLDTQKQIETARAKGTLVYGLRGTELVAYTTTTTPPTRSKKQREAEDARAIAERVRRIAVRARQAFLTGTYLKLPPDPAELHQVLVDAILCGRYPDRGTLKLAGRWMQAADVVPEMSVDKYIAWAAAHPDPDTRDHLAWAGLVTADEQAARNPHNSWGLRETRHLNRLIAAGYEPTPWERERLAEARDYEPCGNLDCTLHTWHHPDPCELRDTDSTESPETEAA